MMAEAADQSLFSPLVGQTTGRVCWARQGLVPSFQQLNKWRQLWQPSSGASGITTAGGNRGRWPAPSPSVVVGSILLQSREKSEVCQGRRCLEQEKRRQSQAGDECLQGEGPGGLSAWANVARLGGRGGAMGGEVPIIPGEPVMRTVWRMLASR